MNYFKITLIVCASFLITSFSGKSENYISTSSALKKYNVLLKNKTFFIFPELRENPIKWFDSIPEGKISNSDFEKSFSLSAQPGEFYVYQVGVWALKSGLEDIQVEFSDLKDRSSDKTVSAGNITCFNKGGTDFMGKKFTKKVNIEAGRIQALWMGIDLTGVEKGNYTGSVSIVAGGEKQTIPIQLKVAGETVPNHGYNEGKRLSRLDWLNSTVGIDDEITKGYIPVKVEGNKVSILGRTLNIAGNGLPASITSFFSASNQSLVETGEPVVSQSFRFIIEKENGEFIRLKPGKLSIKEQTPSKVIWNVLNTSKECDLECTGQMEFDGFVDYHLKLTAKVPLKIKDIRLEIPVVKEKAEYMMGLGHEGGYRTPDWKWKWDVTKNQDMLWVGAVNGGLRVKWKAENYVRPLVNIYYEFGPLKMPPSWENEGKGGVNVGQQNGDIVINAYSGNREMKSGAVLNYDFELLITPFRLIDRQNKFNDRYYHGGSDNTSVKIENAKKAGANVINIHHAEDIYPFINYPYLDANVSELTQLVTNAHKENMRMKFYYTTRELTKNLPEFRAFNSLDGEVIFPGPGNATRTEALHPNGPNEWLVKNMREKYIPAWYNPVKEGKFKGETDLSVITTPDSRLNNFYIAGLDWMVQNMGIDGVYIDDSALDRFTLRRARKIIDQYRPEGRMDLHSWNHFCQWAGFTNCLNLYMDLLPYFDLVWIGEGRDYNRLPDHWLIEVSGIPFGLPGQMLEGGGNPWRGMVYGITNRAGWTKNTPEYLWKFFDEYRFSEREMIGYWEKDCPVTSNNPLVKASVYKGSDDVIVSVANWTNEDEKTSIAVDWAKLGIDPAGVVISIPEIKDFQSGQTTVSLDKLTIPGGKGYLIVLKKKFHARFVHDLQMGKKITIVTMGTSLTGGGYRWPDVMMTEWLDKEFPAQVTLYNEGVGASASSIGPNGDPKLSGLGKLPAVISHNPDVVFIEFGTNDAYLPYNISLGDSKKNLETMINSILKANPKAEIILATMNSCKDNPSVPDASSSRPRLERYYQGYREFAKARNLILLDYYPAWLRLMKDDPAHFDKLVPDGVHPSLEAYRTILLPILRQTLGPGYSTNPFQRVKKGK